MRLTHLRVKIRSLAAEQKIIRHEELRCKKRRSYREDQPGARDLFWSLRGHRNGLSNVIRSSLLAYAAMRGRAYEMIEAQSVDQPTWADVKDTALRFGAHAADIDAWIAVAEKHWYAQRKVRLDRERSVRAAA